MKKSPARSLGAILAIIVVVLLALGAAAEAGTRWFVSSQMSQQFAADQGSAQEAKPKVSFGSSPLLLGLLTGKIPHLSMSTPSTLKVTDGSISGQPASELSIDGLTTSEPQLADFLRSTSTLPDDFLLATIQQGIAQQSGSAELGQLVLTDVSSSRSSGDVEVEFGGGLFSLTLKPVTTDAPAGAAAGATSGNSAGSGLKFEATSSKLLAWELPQEATAAISTALSEGLDKQLSGGQLQVEKVDVLDGELRLTMSGHNVNLSELNSTLGTQPASS